MRTLIEVHLQYNKSIGNPLVTLGINGTFLPDTLVDLEATINAITVDTMTFLQLNQVNPTPNMLELLDTYIFK